MEPRHITGTLGNGTVQRFVFTSTGKLSLNGLAKNLKDDRKTNLANVDDIRAFGMARKYWHK